MWTRYLPFLFAITLAVSSANAQTKNEAHEVIAVVEGKILTLKTIHFYASAWLGQNSLDGLDPDDPTNKKALKKGFLHAMRDTIRQQTIQQLNITVTRQELKEEWNRQVGPQKGLKWKETYETTKNIYTRLIPALKEIHEQGEDPDVVFGKYYPGNHNPDDRKNWNKLVQQFDTPEEIGQLEALQRTLDNPEWIIDQWRVPLQNRKLNQIIDHELASTDPEVAAYLNSIQSESSTNPIVLDLAPFSIKKKRRTWWRKKHKTTHIEFKVLKFKRYWNEYLDSPVR